MTTNNEQQPAPNLRGTMINDFKNFYFLGIGGIGMSALARYFKSEGYDVAGYDRTPSDLTEELESEGISIHFEDDISRIHMQYLQDKIHTLIVYTPAIPKDHLEYNYFIKEGFIVKKRAEVLAAITKDKYTIAVAGTHGKTSTATMISHILKTGNIPFYGFLGGISVNYNTNYISPLNGRKAEIAVVEADEFDRSFLQLSPDVAIITAVEPDHLDIYGTEENMRKAFMDFASRVGEGGKLIVHEGTHITEPEEPLFETYGTQNEADVFAENISVKEGKYHFDLLFGNRKYRLDDLQIGVPGRHNIENCLAAVAATYAFFDDDKVYYEALKTYRGVKRRFEIIFENSKISFVDDYAHHPTEIRVTLETLKELHPGEKILGIFQPHLYSRTRDLAQDFAASLSLLDELILLPIYPARELPIPGVTSELILKDVHCAKRQIVEKENVVAVLAGLHADVIVTLGAGDIDRLVQPIKELLEQKYKS
jgi:UDP-N-acetylmuramate--alanine ligase